MLPFCEEDGVGVISYNPIAGGLLSGKHGRSLPRRGQPVHARQRRADVPGAVLARAEFETVEAVRKLADRPGCRS